MRRLILGCVVLTACFARPHDVADQPGGGSDAGDGSGSGSDAGPACTPGMTRCTAGGLERCSDGAWVADPSCATFCSGASCVAPPSCSAVPSCFAGNCCKASFNPGGAFKRSYDAVTATDGSFAANPSAFLLDDFEVTVARFRRFTQAYPGSKPAVGAGANPHVTGDTGWQAAWDSALPADRPALETALASCTGATYTTATTSGDDLPVNCVTWYMAYAFCAWDGGRLATEAEWNYAATGGDQQRVYPWSVPADSTAISAGIAVYNTTALASVGSRSPQGNARFGESDLAGNVAEWVLDWYATPYPTTTCDDCAALAATTTRNVRGGSYLSSAGAVTASFRTNGTPTSATATIGIRCARNP